MAKVFQRQIPHTQMNKDLGLENFIGYFITNRTENRWWDFCEGFSGDKFLFTGYQVINT